MHKWETEVTAYLDKRDGRQDEIRRILQGETIPYDNGQGGVRFVNYGDYTTQKRQELANQKREQIHADDDEFFGVRTKTAQREHENFSAKRKIIITENRLNDRLNQGAGVQNAAIELDSVAINCRNLVEFMRSYEDCQDPFLQRAFQLKGAAIARQRWPNEPANGSFSKQLERDRLAYYENDDSRALLEKMQSLKAGLDILAKAGRALHREANGVSTPKPGSYARQMQELQTAMAVEIEASTGQAQPGSEVGFHGGVYMPSEQKKLTI